MDLVGKKVLILGFSLTGKKSAEYFHSKGAKVFISEFGEQKEQEEVLKLENKGIKIEFGNHSDEFIKDADFVIISPSINDTAPVLSKLSCPVYSDIEFAGVDLSYQDKMVLVTGTNGKTTTTMLISAILSKKYNAPYVGNIGVPALSALLNGAPDYLVTEASSYQLHYSRRLTPFIAILCNITPDHLIWHHGMEAYIKDKTDILKRMGQNSYVILNYDDPHTKEFADDIKANIYYFSLKKNNYEKLCYLDDDTIYFKGEKIINVKETPLKGNHNYQNIMCSVISGKLAGLDNETIKGVIKKFNAPAHRLEFIRKIGKTAYYNDSKATNPEASNVAINSFPKQKVVLIAGGCDKNTPLDKFVSCIRERTEKVVLIGEAKKRFKRALLNAGYNNIEDALTLYDAIEKASENAPDVVLFSPACASFDMFDNFEVRGECFRNYVLQKRTSE